MKRIRNIGLILLMACLGAIGFALASPMTGHADPVLNYVAVENQCNPQDVSGSIADNHDGTATATFSLNNCSAQITLEVFTKNAEGVVFPQTLSSSLTNVVDAGEHQQITIALPACFFQADLVIGPAQLQLTDYIPYPVVASLLGGHGSCDHTTTETTTVTVPTTVTQPETVTNTQTQTNTNTVTNNKTVTVEHTSTVMVPTTSTVTNTITNTITRPGKNTVKFRTRVVKVCNHKPKPPVCNRNSRLFKGKCHKIARGQG